MFLRTTLQASLAGSIAVPLSCQPDMLLHTNYAQHANQKARLWLRKHTLPDTA
jgi:hypothetical protein